MKITVSKATNKDWQTIMNGIEELELDNKNIFMGQFIVCKNEQTILGFGRIKKHLLCDELCSLGVLEQFRNKGIGKQLIKKLIEMATRDLYLATIIPEYFSKFGFSKTCNYPPSMHFKRDDCEETCDGIAPTIMIFSNTSNEF